MNAALHGQIGDNYFSGEPVNDDVAWFMDDTGEADYLYLTTNGVTPVTKQSHFICRFSQEISFYLATNIIDCGATSSIYIKSITAGSHFMCCSTTTSYASPS